MVDVGDTVVTLGEIWIGLRVGYCGSMPWKVNFHYWNCRFFCDTNLWVFRDRLSASTTSNVREPHDKIRYFKSFK